MPRITFNAARFVQDCAERSCSIAHLHLECGTESYTTPPSKLSLKATYQRISNFRRASLQSLPTGNDVKVISVNSLELSSASRNSCSGAPRRTNATQPALRTVRLSLPNGSSVEFDSPSPELFALELLTRNGGCRQ